MPRAFLITNRRYDTAVEYEESPSRENSPERRVSTAEGQTDDDDQVELLKPANPVSPANTSRGPEVTSTQDPDSIVVINGEVRQTLIPQLQPGQYLPIFPQAALITVIRHLVASPSTPKTNLVLTSLEHHMCQDCGKRYSTSSNLARHRQTHRGLTDKKARKCPHCDKVYVSMPAYSMHVRTHSQGCQCPYCGKCFSRPWLLQGHIRTHTGEKPFRCPVCSKAFADKSNLRAHIQTHSSSKPFICRRCGKAFALKSYLYKHEESSCMRLNHHHHQGKQEKASQAPA